MRIQGTNAMNFHRIDRRNVDNDLNVLQSHCAKSKTLNLLIDNG